MSLSSVLQPALVTVASSPLIHTHTPAAKSLAELVQEEPRTDRHVVDQLLKQYELLYKVGVAGEGRGMVTPPSGALQLTSPYTAGYFSTS